MSAVLKCQVDLNSTVSWNGPNGNYGSIKYAEGPDINPFLHYEGQLKIVGNILNGEYFMKIRNVSKERTDYSPVIEISKTITESLIKFTCYPSGEPSHYSFANWEHHSEFNEFIRSIKGSADGTLTILRSSYNVIFNGNDGIYTCKASNGLPIFVNSNKAIEFGLYGQIIDLTVLVYNNGGSIMTNISKQDESLNIQGKRENSSMNDVFHGIKITVSGIKITFQLSLKTEADFTSYFINACNQKGCPPDPPTDVYVIPFTTAISVFWSQGSNGDYEIKCTNVYSYYAVILAVLACAMTICLIISCILCFRRRSNHLAVETSPGVRYDEIGTIHFINASVDPTIHVVHENVIDNSMNNDILLTSDSDSSDDRTFTGQTGDGYEKSLPINT
ncbi:unnamed protein product [Mytilus edulis]|uniref:Ig-like domain-containing protein n=1 Tax=Mytilus edulis TaxID=6550 RepID=A0A8S3RKY2_MYTED|nr:unnamed protein product [Mytilus edulis]